MADITNQQFNLADLEAAETAVIVVDMQNDFGMRGGMMDLAGSDIEVVRPAIEPTRRVLAAAREAGIKVVYLQHGYSSDLSDMGRNDAKNWLVHADLNVGGKVVAPDGRESRILIRDTWNTEIVEELTPTESDLVIGKTRYSGFYETTLHETLQGLGVRNVVMVGWTTSDCVDSTVRDAFYRGYRAVVLRDCTAEVHGPEFHETTLRLIAKMFGWVSDSAEFLAAFSRSDDSTSVKSDR